MLNYPPNLHASQFLYIFGCIIMVAVIRYVTTSYKIPIPYTTFVVILGVLWGIGGNYSELMEKFSEVAHLVVENVEIVHLPVIIFGKSFRIDVNAFMKSLPQILIISIPISILSAFICGLVMRLVIDSAWTLSDALVFGIISASIFPMEIVRQLQETSIRTKYVVTLLEGETILSAYAAAYVFDVLMLVQGGWIVHWYQFAMGLVRQVVIAWPMSYFMGLFGVYMMKFTYTDTVNLMLLTLTMCYSSYYLAEWISFSGPVSTMVTGIMMGMERPSLSKKIEKSTVELWHVVTDIMNGTLMIVAGTLTPDILNQGLFFKDYVLVFVTYLMWNLSRFIAFFLFSPLLSRIGYGMSFQNMIVCVWGGIKSPICLNMVLMWYNVNHTLNENKADVIFLHTLCVYLLFLLINGSLFSTLIKALGLTDISMLRQINMNNCMRYVYEARARTIGILKMDRFLTDANWPLVLTVTAMENPYKKTNAIDDNVDSDDEEDRFLRYKLTFCPDCEKSIPNEPSPRELKEMLKEAKLRVLKLKKAAYSRQFESGMLSNEGIRIIHQAVDIAMDSSELVIELEGLYKMFEKEGRCYRCLRNRVQALIETKQNVMRPPRKQWRRWCYRVINHFLFSICMHVIVVLNIFQIFYYTAPLTPTGSYMIFITNIIFLIIYVLEFWLKVIAYSWILVIHHGIRTYFRSVFNVLEFIIIWCLFVNLTVSDILKLVAPSQVSFYLDTFTICLLAMRFCKLFRYCRHFMFWKTLPSALLKYLDVKVDRYRALAYELGKNSIAAEEEILENLYQTVDNDSIRAIIKQRTETDRLEITKKLGLAQKEAPSVSTTVNTKIAIRSTLNAMKEDVYELKVSGWVDDVEYKKLLKSLNERFKNLNGIKAIPPPTSKLIFGGIPYMGDDNDLVEFLYTNVTSKKFEPGELVWNEGEIVEGIYVLMSGMLLESYIPRIEVLSKLRDVGALPAVSYLYSPTYEEAMYEYILPGNTIGELCLLNDRAYNGTITAETYSQVFIMKREIIKKAMDMDSDPIMGLECRMWKSVGFRRALNLMFSAPPYRSYTQNMMKYTLERSFVPNLSNYKAFVVNEMIQDIFLLEGIVIDFNTRDMYTAPCYIPRAVQKLVLPKSSYLNVDLFIETKLMIIPAKDVNEYEIMYSEEELGDLVDANSKQCVRNIIRRRSSLSSNQSIIPFPKQNKLLSAIKQLKKRIVSGEIHSRSNSSHKDGSHQSTSSSLASK